jgi:hypothetical protein
VISNYQPFFVTLLSDILRADRLFDKKSVNLQKMQIS